MKCQASGSIRGQYPIEKNTFAAKASPQALLSTLRENTEKEREIFIEIKLS